MPLDVGFHVFTFLQPMHCAYSNFQTIRSKAKMPIFKYPANFSLTFLLLNDVNVRGSNVIKQSHEISVLVKC